MTAVYSANARQTIGASRKRFNRGVNVVDPNCTTRNSSEKTMPMKVTVPAPTATSISIARLVETSNPTPTRGATKASATAIATASNCTIPARSVRLRRSTAASSRRGRSGWNTGGCSALAGGVFMASAAPQRSLSLHRVPQPFLGVDEVVLVGGGRVDVDLHPFDGAGEVAALGAVVVA